MKTCIVQPAYCLDFSESDKFFEWEIEALEKCDESMDLIVLPEYSNVPCLAKTKEQMEESYHKYSELLLKKASETAKRCSATVFVNCIITVFLNAFKSGKMESGNIYKLL